MPLLPRGLLVVFEGIDGTGKSTQVESLASWARGVGLQVRTSFEPTRGPWGMALRRSMTEQRLPLEEELELFCKDRAEHVETLVGPALARGELVILDRYYFSTAAYQGARGELDPEAIIARNEGFAPRPDLLVWLTLDAAQATRRICSRGAQNLFEQEDALRAVADVFERIFASRDVLRLDATNRPQALAGAVQQALCRGALGQVLGLADATTEAVRDALAACQ